MAQTDCSAYTDAHDLVIISYNMHGFNQGVELVKHWCLIKSFDVLIVQEHWLSPATLYRFNDVIGPDFFVLLSLVWAGRAALIYFVDALLAD